LRVLAVFVLLGGSAVGLEGCDKFARSLAQHDAGASGAHPTARASSDPVEPPSAEYLTNDYHYRVLAPGWVKESASESCALQLAKTTLRGSLTLYFYEQSKADLVASNVDEYMDWALPKRRIAKSPTRGPVTPLTVGGYPARQDQLEWTDEGWRWRELLVVIDFGSEFLTISGVGKPSLFDNEALQAVLASVQPSGRVDPAPPASSLPASPTPSPSVVASSSASARPGRPSPASPARPAKILPIMKEIQ
jgi:hypothetical protein